MADLTEQEIKTLVELLGKLEWPVPQEVFYALMKRVPMISYETVPFHWEDGVWKVILLPRPETDPYWPGARHLPGVMLMNNESEDAALERAVSELGGHGQVYPPQFIGRYHALEGNGPGECPRGHEVGLVFTYRHWGELPPEVVLADPGNLPPNMIGFHRGLIKQALSWWERRP